VCELCIHHKVPLQGIIHKCYHSSYAASAMATGFSAIHKLMNTWNSNIDVFITLTSFARTKILQSSLKPEVDKVIVKANFCNDYDTGSEQRNHFFLFAGRLAEEKGIRHLLEAIAQTNEAIIIAGDGPLLEELKQRYLYCKNIEFKGVVQHRELIQLMKECKALIFPSIWYEVLPYVIIEAFSTGTPVLASNTGSMSSLITDGFNGFHFLPGSSEEIKKAIARFHSFPDKKILHENARAYFLKNFTADIHYQTIMNIYEIVCLQSKK
jgi:glycosyltransferase involved in cell wall biosynthesis